MLVPNGSALRATPDIAIGLRTAHSTVLLSTQHIYGILRSWLLTRSAYSLFSNVTHLKNRSGRIDSYSALMIHASITSPLKLLNVRYHSSWTSNCWTQSDSSWTSLISEVKYSSPAYCRVPESNKTQLQQHNKEGNHSISNSYYLHDKSSYRKRNQLDLHELTGTKAFESSGQQPILGRLGTSDSDHHRGSM